jgi:hypothetical protein
MRGIGRYDKCDANALINGGAMYSSVPMTRTVALLSRWMGMRAYPTRTTTGTAGRRRNRCSIGRSSQTKLSRPITGIASAAIARIAWTVARLKCSLDTMPSPIAA